MSEERIANALEVIASRLDPIERQLTRIADALELANANDPLAAVYQAMSQSPAVKEHMSGESDVPDLDSFQEEADEYAKGMGDINDSQRNNKDGRRQTLAEVFTADMGEAQKRALGIDTP
jgi:hypothetical protein